MATRMASPIQLSMFTVVHDFTARNDYELTLPFGAEVHIQEECGGKFVSLLVCGTPHFISTGRRKRSQSSLPQHCT